jgi:hypothetical protein
VLVHALERILLVFGPGAVRPDAKHVLIDLLFVGQLWSERLAFGAGDGATIGKVPAFIGNGDGRHVEVDPGFVVVQQVTAKVIDVQSSRDDDGCADRSTIEPLDDLGLEPFRDCLELGRLVDLVRQDGIVDHDQVEFTSRQPSSNRGCDAASAMRHKKVARNHKTANRRAENACSAQWHTNEEPERQSS